MASSLPSPAGASESARPKNAHSTTQRATGTKMPPLGLETPSKSSGISCVTATGGAKSGAVQLGSAILADRHLARVVAAWPTLADEIRSAILDLIPASDP